MRTSRSINGDLTLTERTFLRRRCSRSLLFVVQGVSQLVDEFYQAEDHKCGDQEIDDCCDKFTTKKSHRLDLDSYKKYDVTESRGTSITQKHNLGYLDVPILFAYALPLSESFRVQLGVGPYFSYGLFGKFKYESDKYLTVSPDKYGENKHTITKDDYPSFGKNDDADDPKGNINRFDWGIAVQGSIYWKRLFLNVAYQKGLKSANITDEKNEGKDKLALSNLSLGLGFIF